MRSLKSVKMAHGQELLGMHSIEILGTNSDDLTV